MFNLSFTKRGAEKRLTAKKAKASPTKKRTRASSIFIEYMGKYYSLHEVAERAKVPYMTMYMRYKNLSKKKRTYAALVAKRPLGRPAA